MHENNALNCSHWGLECVCYTCWYRRCVWQSNLNLGVVKSLVMNLAGWNSSLWCAMVLSLLKLAASISCSAIELCLSSRREHFWVSRLVFRLVGPRKTVWLCCCIIVGLLSANTSMPQNRDCTAQVKQKLDLRTKTVQPRLSTEQSCPFWRSDTKWREMHLARVRTAVPYSSARGFYFN